MGDEGRKRGSLASFGVDAGSFRATDLCGIEGGMSKSLSQPEMIDQGLGRVGAGKGLGAQSGKAHGTGRSGR